MPYPATRAIAPQRGHADMGLAQLNIAKPAATGVPA
jgi:hypothetical protein